MVPEPYGSPVQKDQVVIGIKVLPQLDVPTIVAPEGGGDIKPLPGLSQQLPEQLLLFLPPGRGQTVDPEAELLAGRPLLQQLGVVVGVV